jgi:hypothetical protein
LSVAGSYIVVGFTSVPGYDITEDEQITFTVTDSRFVVSGQLPSPFTVQFTIRALPEVAALEYAPASGVYDAATLVSAIAFLLGMPNTSRISLSLAGSEARLFTAELMFVGVGTEDDPRSDVELMSYLLAYSSSYLLAQAQITCIYLKATRSTCASSPSPFVNNGTTSATNMDLSTLPYWIGGSVMFLCCSAIAIIVWRTFRLTQLSGKVRRSKIKTKDYGPVEIDLSRYEPIVPRIKRSMGLKEFVRRQQADPDDLEREDMAAANGEFLENLHHHEQLKRLFELTSQSEHTKRSMDMRLELDL